MQPFNGNISPFTLCMSIFNTATELLDIDSCILLPNPSLALNVGYIYYYNDDDDCSFMVFLQSDRVPACLLDFTESSLID